MYLWQYGSSDDRDIIGVHKKKILMAVYADIVDAYDNVSLKILR